MTLDQLSVFVASVDLGSLSRAAARLGLSQSTVSFHIANLEADVGTRLLDRGRSGVRPTSAGERLLPRARELLSLAQEARREVAEAAPWGRLVVHASTIPATWLLPPALGRLRERAPGLSVEVRVSDSKLAQRALLERACELALFGSPASDPRIRSAAFAHDRVLLVGRPGLDPQQGLVLREAGSGTQAAVASLLPDSPVRVEVGSTEAVRRCLLSGLGVGPISEIAVREDLEAGRLVVHEWPGFPVERAFFVARLRDSTPTAAARALWDTLKG